MSSLLPDESAEKKYIKAAIPKTNFDVTLPCFRQAFDRSPLKKAQLHLIPTNVTDKYQNLPFAILTCMALLANKEATSNNFNVTQLAIAFCHRMIPL